jgi:hypothetical protein
MKVPILNQERDAIDRLCRDLGLPRGDSQTQSWVYELPPEHRTMASLLRYAAAYSNASYDDTERRLLMKLMLDVTNELLESDSRTGERAWETVVQMIRAHPGLHQDQIDYWSMPGRPLEETFRLTPLVRALREEEQV